MPSSLHVYKRESTKPCVIIKSIRIKQNFRRNTTGSVDFFNFCLKPAYINAQFYGSDWTLNFSMSTGNSEYILQSNFQPRNPLSKNDMSKLWKYIKFKKCEITSDCDIMSWLKKHIFQNKRKFIKHNIQSFLRKPDGAR